ncbi:MAG: hypothetical protein ACKPKO_09305, partial [Candidatus Fonsibacter sp.]
MAKLRKHKLLQSNAWQATMMVWNDGLFSALAAHIIILLSKEAAIRRESGLNFGKDGLFVLVCAAIRRVIGPFQLVMDSILSNNDVLEQFELDGIRPQNVQFRPPSDLLAPARYTQLFSNNSGT